MKTPTQATPENRANTGTAKLKLVIDNPEQAKIPVTNDSPNPNDRYSGFTKEDFKRVGDIAETNARNEREFLKNQGRLSPPKRTKIKNLKSLSFTGRDEEGGFFYWYPPNIDCPKYWDNGCEIGKVFFQELEILAAKKPVEALRLLQNIWRDIPTNFPGTGIEHGFIEELAKAALDGILAKAAR